MKHKDTYVTRQELDDILDKRFQEFEARFEAKMDAKFEIFYRRIVDDLSAVIRDVVELMDRRLREQEKRMQKLDERLARMDGRLHRVETKIEEASAALASP